ncbi:hypothetical protein AUP68_08074 [Ilyonectria robusta]
MPSSKTLLSMLAGAATVAAHGHVNNIVINGASYAGYDVFTLPYESNPPVVVGWAQDATDNGFIAPSAYGTSDIICHKNAENAKGHATVAAGDSIYLQWDTWPDSHKGPVLDYLAACGDSGCESVEKTTLEFFKIGEKGLIDGSASPGTYAADELIDNGIGWLVQIPESIKPGFYVLRHEIIALHSAGNADGAQNYPQCFNLEITGSGTEVPTGTLGTELYKADDAAVRDHFLALEISITQAISWGNFLNIVLEYRDINIARMRWKAPRIPCLYLYDDKMGSPRLPQPRPQTDPTPGNPDQSQYTTLRPGMRITSAYMSGRPDMFQATTTGVLVKDSAGTSL